MLCSVQVSLNRHMRMHSISPVSVQSPPCPPDTADPSAVDRYCQNCDIRFSNLRTYQAHKTHYCNTRHVVKPTPSSSPMMATAGNPSPPASVAVPTYLALPTNPVIVVPYSLVQNASVLSALSVDIGPSPPNDTACIVLSDGTLQPIAQALVPTKYNVIGSGLVNNNNNDNVMQQADNSQTPPAEFFSLVNIIILYDIEHISARVRPKKILTALAFPGVSYTQPSLLRAIKFVIHFQLAYSLKHVCYSFRDLCE